MGIAVSLDTGESTGWRVVGSHRHRINLVIVSVRASAGHAEKNSTNDVELLVSAAHKEGVLVIVDGGIG